MLHVALCTDGVFPHALGGMQRHSRLLAEHLARIPGVRLTVLHPHEVAVFDPAQGIAEVYEPGVDPQRFYLRELWRASGRMAAALDRLKPDVVLSQGFALWQGLDRWGTRTVVHPHGLEMFQGLTRKERLLGLPFRCALGRVARNSARVVSLGGRLTPLLQELVKGSPAQVVVLPNAVEVPPAAPAVPNTEPLQLLFVGRFAFNKGIDVLMEVARRLREQGHGPRVRFLLAGVGPLYAHYQAQGEQENVRLLGRVDDPDLFRLYREVHALVLPTRFEGMPTVVLEAMAQGRPILVSDVGATAELVDAANGMLLPAGDADALHSAVLRFMALDPQERQAMGTASHARAEKHFAWPLVAQRTLEVLREVAATASAGAARTGR